MRKLIFILFTFFTSVIAVAQTKPDTVKIGAYIMSIHDINFRDKEYTMRYWLWMLHNKEGLDVLHQTEIPNAKSVEQSDIFMDSVGNKQRVVMKMKSIMKQNWKVNDYPFDQQELKVFFENTEFDRSQLVFLADSAGSTYDKELTVDGWSITDFKVSTDHKIYETTFGDFTERNRTCDYADFYIDVKLERNALGLFLKLFVGMYISFMIAMVSFLVHPKNAEPRFALPVGALFAAVGNKYIIDSLLPETSSFTLVDTLHTLTFVSVFLIILFSALSLSSFRNGDLTRYRKINSLGRKLVFRGYVFLNLLFVGLAAF
jgi:aromatic ring-cleaving dioxygenase